MPALIRFIDAKEKTAVFINLDHIRIVKPTSDGGQKLYLIIRFLSS
jgi:hypothetical protein